MCKALIASVVLALGVVFLIQEGTNTMVALPGGLRPASAMPTVETVALRKSVTVIRHVAVRHRGVAARRTHIAVGRRGAVAGKVAAVHELRNAGQVFTSESLRSPNCPGSRTMTISLTAWRRANAS